MTNANQPRKSIQIINGRGKGKPRQSETTPKTCLALDLFLIGLDDQSSSPTGGLPLGIFLFGCHLLITTNRLDGGKQEKRRKCEETSVGTRLNEIVNTEMCASQKEKEKLEQDDLKELTVARKRLL